jgi:hypothetical protein
MTDPWTAPSAIHQTMGSCHTPNNSQSRYITIHECDRPVELLLISIDYPIPRCRQSQSLSTRFHCPSQTRQKAPRAGLQASTRVQKRQKCSSGTFLPQPESVHQQKALLVCQTCFPDAQIVWMLALIASLNGGFSITSILAGYYNPARIPNPPNPPNPKISPLDDLAVRAPPL